ncbi:MAG: sulfotransferase domain-containing protein, partial [Deltaproteobacteria bacterium]|nr:sulfotransferase domain-containing protein [Deltaproteobacteria bacterium]
QYKGVFTDGARWSDFEHREGDIFVCTPPKCGTTWTQAICALLVFQTPDLKINPAEISPWFDAIFVPLEEIVSMLEAQDHRRIIKTHTPLDGIPYFDDCSYVAVYRDPRDVYFSMRSHMGNMKIAVPDAIMPEDPVAGFRNWVAADYAPGAGEGFSLAGIVHHLNTFRAFEHLPNIELYHYADLMWDLPAEMQRMASNFEIEVAPELISQLARTAAFDNMKQNAENFAPGADRDVWHDTERFFHKGTSGQWRDVIPQEDEVLFQQALDALLEPEAARWLLGGDAG